jgi:orotidine-5'-phosphate decarboxylase
MTADPRLIVPLDLPTVAEARAMVERLGDAVSFYKIGLELLATGGMALAGELKASGKQVFLDWKLHDIGATVERSAAGAGPGRLRPADRPRRAAGDALGGAGARPSDLKILAVTVLTSLTDADLNEMGYAFGARDLVERRIRQASTAASTAWSPARTRRPWPARSPMGQGPTSWW